VEQSIGGQRSLGVWEETHLSRKIIQSRSPANLIRSNGRQNQRLMKTCIPWIRYRPTYRKFKALKIPDPLQGFGDRFDHWMVGTQFDPSRLHHALWTTTDYFKDRKKARIWRAF